MGGDDSGVRNTFDGQADIVFQAGNVGGDVHIHTRPKHKPARLMPQPTPHFTNQVQVLGNADKAVARSSELMTVVFHGPPGVGKKEVVRTWSKNHSDDYPDGQFHADLSAGSDVDGYESAVLREFLLAAGFEPAQIPDTAEGRAACFRSTTTGKRVLVALDEAKSPRQVRLLSPGPGESVVLVTAVAELAGLSARREVAYIELAPLEADAAKELLRRVIGGGRVDAEPDAVAALMAICEGLPIALCVAGAMLARPRRTVARLVDELSDERQRLAALAVDEDVSVTAVFTIAYGRLSAFAQRCYRIVGAHPGKGDIGVAALSAAAEAPTRDVRVALDELVAAGLLTETDDDRYLPHSLIRLHASDMAAERADESARALSLLLRHYLDHAVPAGHAAMPQRPWLELFFAGHLGAEPPAKPEPWLVAERKNLLAVVKALFDAHRWLDVCALATALWPLHERGKHLDDMAAVNAVAARAARKLDRPDLAALATVQLGFAQLHRGDPTSANTTFTAAVEEAELAGIAQLTATAVESKGLAAIAAGDLAAAEEMLRRNLDSAEAIGDPRRHALARLHLAKAVHPDEARDLLRAASAQFRALTPADDYNAAKTDLWLGRTLTRLDRLPEAERHLADALAVMKDHRKPFDIAMILEAAGDLGAAQGDGQARYEESLALFESGGFLADARRVQDKIAESGHGHIVDGAAKVD